MKVKGIESAHNSTQYRVQKPAFAQHKSRSKSGRSHRAKNKILSATLLFFALVLLQSLAIPPVRAFEDDNKTNEKLHREAKKELRKGQYVKAAEIYNNILANDAQDVDARLGASLAYLKAQDYQNCYAYAVEANKTNPNNARAHALAGLALLRSGYVRPATVELKQALKLDSREALAYGGTAEIDYYEGRTNEARYKALHARGLDPAEPDFLITYARASSRAEDFKEAADAYDLFLQIAPQSDKERRERIEGLIRFYRQLTGVKVHQLYGASVTEIPFRVGSDRRPYMKVKVNGREATFVIDTGSGFTVISTDSAKRLGIKQLAHGGNSQGVGGDGKFPIVYGLLKTIEMGDVKVKMVPCFIRPFHNVESHPSGERADGLIGLSVLSHYLTQLDYKESLLRLDRNAGRAIMADSSSDQVTVVPFRTTQNGLISIETELDGSHTINAILDSAASSTVISTAAVERLNLRDRIIKGQTTNVIGAAGVASNVELLFIRNCRVANLEQNNLRALVLDFNAINETSGFEQSGILGGDFLRHFRVTIDFNRAQIAFQPHSSSVTKQ